MNSLLSRFVGVNARFHTGEVSFSCVKDGRPMAGYYLAGTLLSQAVSGPGVWAVLNLHGFFAPAGKAALAQTVLARLISSHRQNPQWAAMQQGITRHTSQVTAQANAEISKIISDT